MERVIPGTPLIASITRIPNGWAVVGSVDGMGAGTNVSLDVIDDDNNLLVAGKVLFTASSHSDVAFLGDRLAISYVDAGAGHVGFYALDGSMIAAPVTFGASTPALFAHGGELEAIAFTFGSLVARTYGPDGSIIRDARTIVSSGASAVGGMVHDAGGISVMWFGTAPNPPMHIAAITDAGAVRLSDRMYGTSSGGGSMIAVGTNSVLQWDTSSYIPQIVLLDDTLTETAAPSTFLGLSMGAGELAWDGDELGYVRLGTPPGIVQFATADAAAQRTSNDAAFGHAVSGSTGAHIAGGPKRFAFVWGLGSPVTELRFAVVCR